MFSYLDIKSGSVVFSGFLIISHCVGEIVSTTTNKSSDSFGEKQKKQCIESKSDLEFALLSTTRATFLSNHHNLSRALFPPAQVASLYIQILIRFANISSDGNVTYVGQPSKYTWSKSCLFVATKFMSIYAMNFYSFGAVWPNRRESKLELTLPPFCSESERNVQILNSIATLEDLAIVPTSEDPRLNTVECVLEGHDNFQGAKLGYQQALDILCWLIFTGSIVLATVAFYLTKSWLGTDYKLKDEREYEYKHLGSEDAIKDKLKADSLKWLFYILGYFEFILAIVALVLSIVWQRGSFIYPSVYFCVTAVPALIPVIVTVIGKRKINTILRIVECCTFTMTVFDVLMMWSFFMTIHNAIWVLCGVITEPTSGVLRWTISTLSILTSILTLNVNIDVFSTSEYESLILTSTYKRQNSKGQSDVRLRTRSTLTSILTSNVNIDVFVERQNTKAVF